MGLLPETTQQLYYYPEKTFTGDGALVVFDLDISHLAFRNAEYWTGTGYTSLGAVPSIAGVSDYLEQNAVVRVDDVVLQRIEPGTTPTTNYLFTPQTDGWWITFTSAPADGATISFILNNRYGLGNYQFISLNDIINNFMISQVGEGKLISKVRRSDVVFHAHRALAELSFDTFKSTKSQEIEIPTSLNMMLPHDYVNYVKLTWSDTSGIEHVIYPARKTSNPNAINQNTDGSYVFDTNDDSVPNKLDLSYDKNSDTWDKYKAATPSENQNSYDDGTYWAWGDKRYGLDGQYAQVNGSFFIDELKGLIHFSSNISGKTVILHYISDSLGTDDEMQVHKLAEEAMYKWIAYAVLSTKTNIPEYIVGRFKKERFAETRKAKLRLSNVKLEEITQILRGKSKWIKH